ncbi:nuclear transport factor 2 family protein [Caballeronia sordidicola]|uniref:Bile acid 7-alpha dehydratase BaiE n=1 Tax=Caballeronia sordidicola TaxID=196367 RepID=A0A242N540_CABSO|nr:nuclear transport factor 2 family protein [Caballeronia sordidicola]OTP78524.1 Bile acid 7-alpha dehydratase BaiE [Caballeronia sordidicola]
MNLSMAEQLARVAINDLIVRERAVRDACQWSEMGALYHPDSTIDISWFKGSGAQFTAATEKMAAGPLYTFHQMGSSVITLHGNRALVDSNCTVHGFTVLDGVEVDLISYSRLMWRAQRSDSNWLIAGLRALSVRDVLAPVNPLQLPQLDSQALAALRPSYRFIAYLASKAGHPVRNDLPGVDKPETVAVLQTGEQQWLGQKG